MHRLVDDVLCYKLSACVGWVDLGALVVVCRRYRHLLAPVFTRRSRCEIVRKLETTLRGARGTGKCALCESDTLHLVDLTTSPARVVEGSPFCSRHCLRMQNKEPSDILSRLLEHTDSFPVIATVSVQ